jgi:hypothetical protein
MYAISTPMLTPARDAILSAALILVASPALGAPSHQVDEPFWRPMARACAAATDQHGGFWPVWAKCTIAHVWGNAVSETLVDQCISQVQAQREKVRACNNCGDPVRDVIHCATGY